MTADLASREAFRDKIRALKCPRCRADNGQPCTGKGGAPRKSVHQQRIDVATRLRQARLRGENA